MHFKEFCGGSVPANLQVSFIHDIKEARHYFNLIWVRGVKLCWLSPCCLTPRFELYFSVYSNSYEMMRFISYLKGPVCNI